MPIFAKLKQKEIKRKQEILSGLKFSSLPGFHRTLRNAVLVIIATVSHTVRKQTEKY